MIEEYPVIPRKLFYFAYHITKENRKDIELTKQEPLKTMLSLQPGEKFSLFGCKFPFSDGNDELLVVDHNREYRKIPFDSYLVLGDNFVQVLSREEFHKLYSIDHEYY